MRNDEVILGCSDLETFSDLKTFSPLDTPRHSETFQWSTFAFGTQRMSNNTGGIPTASEDVLMERLGWSRFGVGQG